MVLGVHERWSISGSVACSVSHAHTNMPCPSTGPGWLMATIELLQAACDRQVAKIAASFNKHRSIDAKVRPDCRQHRR